MKKRTQCRVEKKSVNIQNKCHFLKLNLFRTRAELFFREFFSLSSSHQCRALPFISLLLSFYTQYYESESTKYDSTFCIFWVSELYDLAGCSSAKKTVEIRAFLWLFLSHYGNTLTLFNRKTRSVVDGKITRNSTMLCYMLLSGCNGFQSHFMHFCWKFSHVGWLCSLF